MREGGRYDVAIVGAGAMGLASAYHLAVRDPKLSILVVEARAGPGEGSMGASNAMVRDVFSSPDNHRLAKSAITFYRSLMAEREDLRTPVPLLDLYGYLWLLPESHRAEYAGIVAGSAGSIDATSVDLDVLRTLPGLDLAPRRWYEGDGAAPPEPITGGLFGRNCGAVAPDLLAHFYYEEAKRRGVEFEFNACVQRLSFDGREEILLHERSGLPFAFQERMRGRLRVSALHLGDGRTVHADRIVVTAGGWTERLLHPLGIATGCSARPQLLFSVSGPAVEELLRWVPALRPIDAPGGSPRFPFVILPTGAFLKPIFTQRQMWIGYADVVAHPIGTREDPARDGRLDYSMAAMGDRDAFATDVLPALSPYLPKLESSGLRLESSWGGYYHVSPDGLPVVADTEAGILFAAGDSGSGVMKADSIGRIVTAKFDGKPEARLFDGHVYRVDRLSLDHRPGQNERIIL